MKTACLLVALALLASAEASATFYKV